MFRLLVHNIYIFIGSKFHWKIAAKMNI